jgi:hypothetical protein
MTNEPTLFERLDRLAAENAALTTKILTLADEVAIMAHRPDGVRCIACGFRITKKESPPFVMGEDEYP